MPRCVGVRARLMMFQSASKDRIIHRRTLPKASMTWTIFRAAHPLTFKESHLRLSAGGLLTCDTRVRRQTYTNAIHAGGCTGLSLTHLSFNFFKSRDGGIQSGNPLSWVTSRQNHDDHRIRPAAVERANDARGPCGDAIRLCG
jgi:hypothetical protein